MAHVCCNDCVGVCGNVCCIATIVCLCKGCDGCCVFVCIATRGAVGGARVWEV